MLLGLRAYIGIYLQRVQIICGARQDCYGQWLCFLKNVIT